MIFAVLRENTGKIAKFGADDNLRVAFSRCRSMLCERISLSFVTGNMPAGNSENLRDLRLGGQAFGFIWPGVGRDAVLRLGSRGVDDLTLLLRAEGPLGLTHSEAPRGQGFVECANRRVLGQADRPGGRLTAIENWRSAWSRAVNPCFRGQSGRR